MPATSSLSASALLLAALLAALAGCAARKASDADLGPSPVAPAQLSSALDRISWGVNYSSYQQAEKLGYLRYLDSQLHPKAAALPAPAQAQIDVMTISKRTLEQLNLDMEQRRKDADKIASDDDKKAAQQAYQQ